MAMVLLTVTDITLRRVFNSPLPFSFELTETLLVIVVFCSVAYTTYIGRHISIDVIVSRFPLKTRKSIETVIDFICAALFGLVAWRSILRAIHIWNIEQVTGILEIPIYPFIFIVALGSTLASLILLVKVINSIIGEAGK